MYSSITDFDDYEGLHWSPLWVEQSEPEKTMAECDCTKQDTIGEIKAIAKVNETRLHQGDIVLNEIKAALKSLGDSQQESNKVQKEMFNRMFIDNGKKSFQTIFARNSVQLGLQWFLLGAIIVSVVSAFISSAIK